MSLDSLDGFLSNVAMLTLKSRQKEFDILPTQLNTTSAVTTGSGVPGSLLAGLLESCQIFAYFV